MLGLPGVSFSRWRSLHRPFLHFACRKAGPGIGGDETWGQVSMTAVGIGPAGAQGQVRGVLSFCTSPLMTTMEASIQSKPGLIAEDGTVSDESTAEFLSNYMKELHLFIERVLTVLPREG